MSNPDQTFAAIRLWGATIGSVAWNADSGLGSFQYDPGFLASGIELSPIAMPLGRASYAFPELSRESFQGLPGMLADSLPDKFGNLLINQWLARQGRAPDSLNPVERLCYIGRRGMGALEFEPERRPGIPKSKLLHIDALVSLANEALDTRSQLDVSIGHENAREAMNDIIRVGTSAGGARAKAIIAWNPDSNEVRSGQVEAPPGFSHWLIKLDGVTGNRDKEVADPLGYGKIEYAYYLMAQTAGVEMSECRLHHEGGRSHFMTRRFDRGPAGEKRHMQTLCGIAHYDFNRAGAYSYEQACQVMRTLDLPHHDIEQQFRRAAFNVLARNQDDHTKNISFLMDKAGRWRLSPAYDICYSYNPSGAWTSAHQMSLNGKRDAFSTQDLADAARTMGVKTARCAAILAELRDAIARWPEFAEQAGIPSPAARSLQQTFRSL